jgi:hypothetical protein
VASPAPSPLDEAQLLALAETRQLTKKLRLARGVALTNVVSLGCFAVLSVGIGALEGTLSFVGLALGGLAWNEERGRALLIAADPRAPRRLALNQLFLLLTVLVYCAWNMYVTWTGPDPLDALLQASPELTEVLKQTTSDSGQSFGDLGGLARSATLAMYAAVAVGSVLVQGLTSYYYASLRSTVEALSQAPLWARSLA